MSADLSYSWQEPLSFWHFTAQAGYNRRFSSVVRGQQVSSGDVALLEVARPIPPMPSRRRLRFPNISFR